jgi:hypothetical protein
MKPLLKGMAWWLVVVLVAVVGEECFNHPPGESQLMILRKGTMLLTLPVLVLASNILFLAVGAGLIKVARWLANLCRARD